MRYLGIDYGRKKIGVALGNGILAEPLKVIRYIDLKWLVQEVEEIVKKEKIDKIVVGVSENEIGEESRHFADLLGAETFDETLTSQDAISLSIQGGIKRKKRKNMEDAYAAAIMLQNYMDNI